MLGNPTLTPTERAAVEDALLDVTYACGHEAQSRRLEAREWVSTWRDAEDALLAAVASLCVCVCVWPASSRARRRMMPVP